MEAKQKSGHQATMETRLNRSKEEVERLKEQIQKDRINNKVSFYSHQPNEPGGEISRFCDEKGHFIIYPLVEIKQFKNNFSTYTAVYLKLLYLHQHSSTKTTPFIYFTKTLVSTVSYLEKFGVQAFRDLPSMAI